MKTEPKPATGAELAAERVKWNECVDVLRKQLVAEREQLAEAQAAMKYIRFQADCWTNTGDIRSLRDAMKSFVAIIDKGGQ